MRVRRSVAVLALALTLVGAGALSAFAAKPPPPVLPHPPPIAATFTVHPDAGPVGTTVTIQGACGFAATTLMYCVNEQRPEGTFAIWPRTECATLTPKPLGAFKVSFT